MNQSETGAWFQTTSWALVVGARASRADLERLLRAYWSPVYAYIRRQGFGQHDAADLTQAFLADILIGRDLIGRANQSKGRFRSFLKSALRNYLVDQRRREGAKRSSAERGAASLDSLTESRGDPAAEDEEPERAFDRQWAAAVLSVAIERTEAACRQDGQGPQWEAFQAKVLRPLLGKTRAAPLEEIAARIGATGPEQVSNMIQTVKRRFRRILKQVVAETVLDAAEVDDELRFLQELFQ